MKMTEQMQKEYDELAWERAKLDVLKTQKAELEKEFKEKNAGLLAVYAEETEKVQVLESRLRTTALGIFAETGEKVFDGGVEIKEFTVLGYEETPALNWAKDHRIALKLDKTAFEKIVKTSPEEFPFVEIKKEPRAQIPQKMEIRDGQG